MRVPLAVELESRDGTISRDSVTQNSLIEIEGEASVIFKRPGVFASQLDYVTPQGFSGLSFTNLPYGEFTDISDLFFGINGDSWSLVNAGTSSGIWDGPPPPPEPEGSIEYHGTAWYSAGDGEYFFPFGGLIWQFIRIQFNEPALAFSATGLDGEVNWTLAATNSQTAYYPKQIGSSLFLANAVNDITDNYSAIGVSSNVTSWSPVAGADESSPDYNKMVAFLQSSVSTGSTLITRNTNATYGTSGLYTSTDGVTWNLVLDFTPLDAFTRGLIQGIVPNGLGAYYCLRPITTFPNSQGLALGWALAASTNLVDWLFYDIESDLPTTGKTAQLVVNGTSLMVLEKSTGSAVLNLRGLDISGTPEMTAVLDSYTLSSASQTFDTAFSFGGEYFVVWASGGPGPILKVSVDLNP